MKLIIDIPETMIQELKDGCFGVKHNVYELAGCIMNGIPLEEELEKVKTKIEDIEELDYDFEGFYHCQNEALKIIDKHIAELKGE